MRVKADQLAFRIRMQFGMKARNVRHDVVNDALLDVSVASNLVACREP